MRHAFGTGVINYAQRYADHEIPYLRQHNDRVWSAQSDPFLLFVSDGYHAASCRVRAYESRASGKPLFKQDLPTYSKKDPGRMTENVQTRRTQSRKASLYDAATNRSMPTFLKRTIRRQASRIFSLSRGLLKTTT